MRKHYWFYFGMGTKRGQIVHKNGIVGADCDFCPIVDIENSVMEEDQVPDFHVVNFQEVPYGMFQQFTEDLKNGRPTIIEPEPEDAGNVAGAGGLGAIGGLLGGLLGGAGENADAVENEEVKVVPLSDGFEDVK
jgi:hypothetical protein